MEPFSLYGIEQSYIYLDPEKLSQYKGAENFRKNCAILKSKGVNLNLLRVGYLGSSNNPKRRLQEHWKNSNNIFCCFSCEPSFFFQKNYPAATLEQRNEVEKFILEALEKSCMNDYLNFGIFNWLYGPYVQGEKPYQKTHPWPDNPAGLLPRWFRILEENGGEIK